MSPVSPAAPSQGRASERPTFVQGSTSSELSYLAHQSQRFMIVPSLDDQSNYLSDPAAAPLPESTMRPRPSFPIHSSPRDTAAKSKLQERISQSTFKAPAHKHAHHLHSIPPREKTTRTLILDHLLWLHGRARFAQARAELGMRTPTNVEQAEDDYASDGEDVEVLGYEILRDTRLSKRDVTMGNNGSTTSVGQQAKGFKARADGLEKVLSAMLDQPPEELPFDQDDLLFADTSFTPPTVPVLPNGVRLRIAIAALANDFFAEDNHTLPPPPSPALSQQQQQPPSGVTAYTPSLTNLARISSFAHQTGLPVLPPFHTISAAAGAGSATSIAPPPGSIFSTIPRGAGPEGPWALGGSSAAASASNSARLPGGFPTYVPPSRAASSILGQSSSSSSVRSFASGFPLSMPLDVDDTPANPPRIFRAVGRSRDLYSSGAYAYPVRANEAPQRPRRCPRHLAIDCPPSSTCTHSSTYTSPKQVRSSRHKSSIGAGLGLSGPPLRRAKLIGQARGKDARMTDLLPRFLRLSALVAVELGRESRGEEWDILAQMDLNIRRSQAKDNVPGLPSSLSSHLSSDSDDDSSARGRNKSVVAARPSRAWYALLSGLLTRAALQGYLVKGWKGTDAVEILLGIGCGQNNPFTGYASPSATRSPGDQQKSPSPQQNGNDNDFDDGLEDFEPDDMPELAEAWDILFGAKFNQQPPAESFLSRSKEAVDEYEKIMMSRISEFFTISPNSGDLSLHLEELARKYPCEPVERAALRFCEAIARWRGRPELETYKPKSPMSQPSSPGTSPGGPQALSIHSLIHPHPQDTPKSLIEKYFIIPKPSDFEVERERGSRRRDSISSVASGTKRSRRNSWADSKGKKPVITHQAWVEEDEYVGPYGI